MRDLLHASMEVEPSVAGGAARASAWSSATVTRTNASVCTRERWANERRRSVTAPQMRKLYFSGERALCGVQRSNSKQGNNEQKLRLLNVQQADLCERATTSSRCPRTGSAERSCGRTRKEDPLEGDTRQR